MFLGCDVEPVEGMVTVAQIGVEQSDVSRD
jgi:hypothetical protein